MIMKQYIFKGLLAAALCVGMTGCGDSFLDTDYYRGIDVDGGLNSAKNVSIALTGAYNALFERYAAGNYATMIGDIPTDLSYWNNLTGHWDGIYRYSVTTTDNYLDYIWEYGYKVADYSSRIIKAGNEIYADATETDKLTLDQCMAEAYALRAYAYLYMTNVYGHQIKVNGRDYSDKPGIVISEEPIAALTHVERSNVGQCYDQIVRDLKRSLEHFEKAGGDRGDKCYMNVAAVEGLLARVSLYMENWQDAKTYAAEAIADGGVASLTYTADGYHSLYNGGSSNTESYFYLDINPSNNWSANSCGTLWTTYNFSPSPKLQAMYGDQDVRTAIMAMGPTSKPGVPVYAGGKFSHYSSNNPAYATNYLVNAPEMYLILAEANLKLNDLGAAQQALLVVAKRNLAITSVSDLPGDAAGLYAFLKDERARELFQEGLRLWDLRRWGDPAQVEAYNAPNIAFRYNNYDISNLVYPIPESEINANWGVTQTEGWAETFPK